MPTDEEVKAILEAGDPTKCNNEYLVLGYLIAMQDTYELNPSIMTTVQRTIRDMTGINILPALESSINFKTQMILANVRNTMKALRDMDLERGKHV